MTNKNTIIQEYKLQKVSIVWPTCTEISIKRVIDTGRGRSNTPKYRVSTSLSELQGQKVSTKKRRDTRSGYRSKEQGRGLTIHLKKKRGHPSFILEIRLKSRAVPSSGVKDDGTVLDKTESKSKRNDTIETQGKTKHRGPLQRKNES